MTADSDNGYRLVSTLFVRLLGIFYLIAFASAGVQIEGLAGPQGILPFGEELEYLSGQKGIERFFELPTLFWIYAGKGALSGAAIAGCVAAVMVTLGWWQRTALIAAFVLYLSLYHASQVFLNFQWDGLLLEAGFLAIFLTPRSRIVIFLFRWLLFRLRFMSGLSKLTLQDPSWWNMTALDYYFEVQPLPNPLAWYAHHLPEWLLRTGTFSTLVVELLVPFMMFLPRRWRFAAAWITIAWQVLIIATSNHNWFNFLTIALCLFLFDDRAVRRVLPARAAAALEDEASAPRAGLLTGAAVTAPVAAFVLFASSVQIWELASMRESSGIFSRAVQYAERYRVSSKYHVFPTMKTERLELELQGSPDGLEWRPYVFKYKPGDVHRRPGIVVPHQPRLDWMMWFVTLHPMFIPWFEQFLQRLLDNSPAVTALLEHNPFPDEPPRYIRVEAWRYSFSSPEQKAANGQWWQREPLGMFQPLPWIGRDGAR